MRKLFLLAVLLVSNSVFAGGALTESIKSIEGKKFQLSEFSAKAILVVNIATKCGYTKQLEGLEALYKKYKDQGLVVVGIPSNDFGGQTPEDEGEVKSFCKINYGVTFPLTEKVLVKGEKKHPLIKDLVRQSEGASEVAWNFEKFLLNKKGQVVARYLSKVNPESEEIRKKIESLL